MVSNISFCKTKRNLHISGLDKSNSLTSGTSDLLGRTSDQWAEVCPRATAFFRSGKCHKSTVHKMHLICQCLYSQTLSLDR